MIGNICIIPGTRPEAIRMSPVARACELQGALVYESYRAGSFA
jgi:UDP-N-acetylglucosamine 2-epimerase